jgi:hypothetical protein
MSISPDYFRDYYATLTQPIVAALIRADGVVLARYSGGAVSGPALCAGNAFQTALDQDRQVRPALVVSALDGQRAHVRVPQAAAHSRLQDRRRRHRGHHRGVAGRMSRHLISGFRATAAMIALCLLALRRTRREAAANRMLREKSFGARRPRKRCASRRRWRRSAASPAASRTTSTTC